MKPKGKGLMLAIGLGKGGEDDEEEAPASERGEGEGDDAIDEAAGEAFDAVKKGDKSAFIEAFKAAVYACSEE